MLAHLCVSYEMAYTDKHKKPGKLLSFILKVLVKKSVVGPKPYKKNSQTAPAFLITDERQFEHEKKRLLGYVNETQQKGASFFEGKESLSFGVLTIEEWNTLFAKHLDHHLKQFGA